MFVASAQPSKMGTGFLWEGWRRGRYFVALSHNAMTGIYTVMSLLPSLWYPQFFVCLYFIVCPKPLGVHVWVVVQVNTIQNLFSQTQSNSAVIVKVITREILGADVHSFTLTPTVIHMRTKDLFQHMCCVNHHSHFWYAYQKVVGRIQPMNPVVTHQWPTSNIP